MVTIGTLAKHYGKLPSEIVAHGTTYDVMVYDIMTAWEQYQRNPGEQSNYREEDLMAMLKGVK